MTKVIYHLSLSFASLVLDRMAAAEKDLEITLLREQWRILERDANAKSWLLCPEKLMLVALAGKLKGKSRCFRDRLRGCVQPIKPVPC